MHPSYAAEWFPPQRMHFGVSFCSQSWKECFPPQRTHLVFPLHCVMLSEILTSITSYHGGNVLLYLKALVTHGYKFREWFSVKGKIYTSEGNIIDLFCSWVFLVSFLNVRGVFFFFIRLASTTFCDFSSFIISSSFISTGTPYMTPLTWFWFSWTFTGIFPILSMLKRDLFCFTFLHVTSMPDFTGLIWTSGVSYAFIYGFRYRYRIYLVEEFRFV